MALIVKYIPPRAPLTDQAGPWCSNPTGLPDTVILASDIIDGSLSLSAASTIDAPTVVVSNYRPSSGDASGWVTQPARQSVVGVDSGSVDEINSDINLPGVRRLVEALRKSRSRLTRLQFPGRYSWRAFDSGIKFQKGDVVVLPDIRGLYRQFVRIMNISMVELGIYQIDAEHYDVTMYADQIVPDGENGVVPVGLILPYEGALPGGWEDYSDADGKYIIGAGGDTAIGEVAGVDMPAISLGWTEMGGSHVGTKDFYYSGFPTRVGNSTEGLFPPPQPQPQPQSAGEHRHPFNIPAFDPNPYRRHQKLMKKIGSTSVTVPAEAMIFGRDEIYYAGLQRIIEHNNKLLVADSVSADAGQFSLAFGPSYITLVFDGQHRHTQGFHGHYHLGTITGTNHIEELDPPHDHGLFTGISQQNLRRRYLPVYGSNNDFVVRPGMIGMWDGDMDDLPENYYLCDGENGTIDLVDYFISFAGSETTGPTGDNSVKIVGWTPYDAGHNHKGGPVPDVGNYVVNRSHAETIFHRHAISASIPWQPPGYALAFIQYLP